MKKLYGVLALLCAISLPAASRAQTLWQNAKVGMSSAEVLMVYPTAAKQDQDKGITNFTLPKVDVMGTPFTPHLLLRGDALYEVDLFAVNDSRGQGMASPTTTFSQVKEALTGKYGRPVRDDRSTVIASNDVYYIDGDVNIVLGYLSIPSLTMVSVKYTPKRSASAPL